MSRPWGFLSHILNFICLNKLYWKCCAVVVGQSPPAANRPPLWSRSPWGARRKSARFCSIFNQNERKNNNTSSEAVNADRKDSENFLRARCHGVNALKSSEKTWQAEVKSLSLPVPPPADLWGAAAQVFMKNKVLHLSLCPEREGLYSSSVRC